MTDPSELLLPDEKPRFPCSETPVLRLMEGMAEYRTAGELLTMSEYILMLVAKAAAWHEGFRQRWPKSDRAIIALVSLAAAAVLFGILFVTMKVLLPGLLALAFLLIWGLVLTQLMPEEMAEQKA